MEKFPVYESYLFNYASGLSSIDGDTILLLDRLDEVLSPNIILGGEVGRVDLTSDGYAIWLFSEQIPDNWRNELRMPLLQYLYTQKFGAPSSEVKVGVYGFEAARYDFQVYSEAHCKQAMVDVTGLALQMEKLLSS